MLEKIELFGTEIKLRTHNCSLFGDEGAPIEEPYINFYVRTKFCNAKCEFCTYHSDASKWNGKKYREVLEHITSRINIRKIAVSGGEPTLYWDNFLEIANVGVEFAPDCELSLNTDGFRWQKLFDDPISKRFDYIQLSRHHYDDKINDEIFKCKTPSSEEIKAISELQTHPHQVQFRCNLIKNYIDSKEEIFKFLDWTNSVGINDVGLVSLMPINDYSKENYIYFHIKELIGDNFFLTKSWKRQGGGCECFNYVYMPPEDSFRRPMKVYHKNTFAPSEIQETIVFDGQNVRLGFDGPIIY